MLFASGCALSPRPDPDFASVALTAISKVEAQPYEAQVAAQLTYVVPSTIDPRARVALASLRKVVAPTDVPTFEEVSFPAGYFKVEAFQVSGDTALFQGTQGPIYVNNPLSCGRGISVPLHRSGGAWVASEIGWRLC
jgi:hypothetical protein